MALDVVRNEPSQNESSIEIAPLAVHIGAEIGGVDFTKPLPAEQIRDIEAALVKWKVVFFRDQFLDHDQHRDMARQFGELTPGHAVYGNVEGYKEIYSIAKHRKAKRFSGESITRPWSGWHTDITAAINPPAASILRGDIVPPFGGDTQFTNLEAAYNGLSQTLRGYLDGLRAIHRFAPPPGVEVLNGYANAQNTNTLVSEHPLIRVHPVSGKRTLYVSPSFLKSIVGLAPRESQVLVEFLWEHVVRPEYTVRFKWRPGSIAFWDNRSTAHLAPVDIFDSDFDRQFYRITLVGDVPVGIDGRESTSIEGDAILAA
jgi:alpha-ketoglutarate-dependent taurine dioxygenase